jgi:hypothetical protein
MTDTRVNLFRGIFWANINVKGNKHEGTLGDLNVAILPKKSEVSEQAWQAIGCLESVWKSYIRMVQYPKDAARHETAMTAALNKFRRLSGVSMPKAVFRDLIISALNVHYSKKDDAFKAVALITFKKAVIRMTMRIQKGEFSLINEVKGDKVKTAPCKNFNINDLNPEQICKLLGITEEQWAAIQAAKKVC